MSNTIKVLVVDDSAFMRKIIGDMLESDSEIEVIARAKNGEEAIELNQTLKPDVITMDIEMPVMNGREALKKILALRSVPVIMFSSLTKKNADVTMEVLNDGAYDFITKPSSVLNITASDLKEELIIKVKSTKQSNLSLLTKTYEKLPPVHIEKKPIKRLESRISDTRFKTIIGIGTSTGGPKALQQVIPKIPKDINAPIIVVQHMPEGFTKSLAERLNKMSEIQVKEAENNEQVLSGVCYIAPGGKHLQVIEQGRKYYIQLNTLDKISGHRPSVDYMMETLLELKLKKIAVIMTGMGSDGAKAIKKIYDQGYYTIAQDESSCVVYGMPKSAVRLNGISKIVDLSLITKEIVNAMEV